MSPRRIIATTMAFAIVFGTLSIMLALNIHADFRH